jgi:hypothetical protein
LADTAVANPLAAEVVGMVTIAIANTVDVVADVIAAAVTA